MSLCGYIHYRRDRGAGEYFVSSGLGDWMGVCWLCRRHALLRALRAILQNISTAAATNACGLRSRGLLTAGCSADCGHHLFSTAPLRRGLHSYRISPGACASDGLKAGFLSGRRRASVGWVGRTRDRRRWRLRAGLPFFIPRAGGIRGPCGTWACRQPTLPNIRRTGFSPALGLGLNTFRFGDISRSRAFLPALFTARRVLSGLAVPHLSAVPLLCAALRYAIYPSAPLPPFLLPPLWPGGRG